MDLRIEECKRGQSGLKVLVQHLYPENGEKGSVTVFKIQGDGFIFCTETRRANQ